MRTKSNRYWLEVALAYGLMLLLIWAGSSCSTKKNFEKTHIDTSSVKRVERDDVWFDTVSNTWRFEWDSLSLNRFYTITIFDTDKTDSLGQHPVKAVIEGVDDFKHHSEKETIKEESTNIQVTHNDSVVSQNNIVEEEKETRESKPSLMADFGGLFCFLLLFFVITISLKVIVNKVLRYGR